MKVVNNSMVIYKHDIQVYFPFPLHTNHPTCSLFMSIEQALAGRGFP